MKLALFKDPKNDWIRPVECPKYFIGEDTPETYSSCGDVRVTEWAEVEFTPRAPEELVPAELAVLDKAEIELRTKFNEMLHEIAEKRARLLCLTHDTVDADPF